MSGSLVRGSRNRQKEFSRLPDKSRLITWLPKPHNITRLMMSGFSFNIRKGYSNG